MCAFNVCNIKTLNSVSFTCRFLRSISTAPLLTGVLGDNLNKLRASSGLSQTKSYCSRMSREKSNQASKCATESREYLFKLHFLHVKHPKIIVELHQPVL